MAAAAPASVNQYKVVFRAGKINSISYSKVGDTMEHYVSLRQIQFIPKIKQRYEQLVGEWTAGHGRDVSEKNITLTPDTLIQLATQALVQFLPLDELAQLAL